MADAPYLSMQRFPGNGTTTDWTVNFAGNTPSNENWYIEADDIEAIEVIPATALAAEVRIERTVTRIGPSQFRVTPAVASGRILVLRRKTENRFNLVDFQSLQAVSEYDLDLANKQLLFVTQEASDQARLAEERSFAAETIAYSSVNDAAEALTNSQDARTRAINAQTVAGSAQSAAANAVSTANSANTTASAANTTANAANSTANTALTTANAADTKANQAISTANSATATANGASSVALAASTDAAAALDAAEQAELAASSAQTISQAAQSDAADAVTTANAAAATANAIDGKAQEALDNSAYATARADLAMSLVEDAGVGTFNGRAGAVVPEAGDYTAAQISHGTGSTVEEALQDLTDYDTVLQQHITSEVNRVSTDFTNYLNSIDQAKLDKSGTAVDSQKLGGQVASYYATAAALTAGLGTKLDSGAKAAAAATADKLTTARTINGVSFNGTANITIEDATKLPLTGGVVTGEIQLRGTASNWAGIGMDPNRAYSLRIHSPNIAYTYIGARNTSYTHYESGTGSHYFYGQIVCQGNVTAYSDLRKKKDLVSITDAAEKVLALHGYTYERTDLFGTPRSAGVIAQDVLCVLPEAVRECPETGDLSVDYNGLVGLLVNAVNELTNRVKELENGAAK